MVNVRDLTPLVRGDESVGPDEKPFTRGMDECFSGILPRRWMETLMTPMDVRRPTWTDFDNLFEGLPRIDLVDREEELVVRTELPGVRKGDLDIRIAGDRLVIEARRESKEESAGTYFRSEMACGRLLRTIDLPLAVHGGRAKATLEDGILEIVIPKVEAARPHSVKVA
jgi:HSP20 family protein